MTLLSTLGATTRLALNGPAGNATTQANLLKAQQNIDAEQAAQDALDEKQADAKTASSFVSVDISALRQSLTYRATSTSASSTSSLPGTSILQKLGNLPSASSQRKNAARARLNRLKSQIDAMKRMAIALNPRAAKALASVLKMLAAQLKSAAAELAGGDGGGSSAGSTMNIQVNGAAAASSPTSTGSTDATNSAATSPVQSQPSPDAGTSGDSDTNNQSADGGASSNADTASAAQAQAQAAADSSTPDQSAATSTNNSNSATSTTSAAEASHDGKSTDADKTRADDKAAAQDAQQLAQTAAQAASAASKPASSANFKMPGAGGNGGGGMSASDKALVEAVARSLQQLVALVKMHLREKNKDIQGAESAIKDAVKIAEGGSTGAATVNVAVGNLGGDPGSGS